MAINRSGQVLPDAGPVAYAVTSQQETTDLGPDGRPTLGHRIYFQTARGQTGSVFVPASRYNINNVRAQITPLAQQLDMVAQHSEGM